MEDEEFEQLLEQSSLGSPGARRLRDRASQSQVDLTRRIAQLRNQMIHGDGRARAAARQELIQLLLEHDYMASAEDEREDPPADGPLTEDTSLRQPASTTRRPVRSRPYQPTPAGIQPPAGGLLLAVKTTRPPFAGQPVGPILLRELAAMMTEVDPGIRVAQTLISPRIGSRSLFRSASMASPFDASLGFLTVTGVRSALPAVLRTVVEWMEQRRDFQPLVALATGRSIIEVEAGLPARELNRLLALWAEEAHSEPDEHKPNDRSAGRD